MEQESINDVENQETLPEPVQEKMLPQSQVDQIVKGRMASAAAKAREEAYAEAMQQFQSQNQGSQGGMQQPNVDIDALVDARLNHRAQELMDAEVGKQLQQKLTAGMQKYPDFAEKVGELQEALGKSDNILRWANSLDNTADVIYDIVSNPSKFAYIRVLAHDSPAAAQREMAKLSESIKRNEQATQDSASVNAPLDQMKPSVSATDNGSLTVQDMRNMSWARA